MLHSSYNQFTKEVTKCVIVIFCRLLGLCPDLSQCAALADDVNSHSIQLQYFCIAFHQWCILTIHWNSPATDSFSVKKLFAVYGKWCTKMKCYSIGQFLLSWRALWIWGNLRLFRIKMTHVYQRLAFHRETCQCHAVPDWFISLADIDSCGMVALTQAEIDDDISYRIMWRIIVWFFLSLLWYLILYSGAVLLSLSFLPQIQKLHSFLGIFLVSEKKCYWNEHFTSLLSLRGYQYWFPIRDQPMVFSSWFSISSCKSHLFWDAWKFKCNLYFCIFGRSLEIIVSSLHVSTRNV